MKNNWLKLFFGNVSTSEALIRLHDLSDFNQELHDIIGENLRNREDVEMAQQEDGSIIFFKKGKFPEA